YAAKENIEAPTIHPQTITFLQQYIWKGNIRELKNVLERACIMSDGSNILPEHLPYNIQQQQPNLGNELSLSSVEKKHIQKVLQHTKGNKTKAAELMGIGLTTLYRKLEEYQLPI
ncbi:MAG: sigma-54-dependent Fis family transcriptional regulator, partial [Sphingobacteriia bacterium]